MLDDESYHDGNLLMEWIFNQDGTIDNDICVYENRKSIMCDSSQKMIMFKIRWVNKTRRRKQ